MARTAMGRMELNFGWFWLSFIDLRFYFRGYLAYSQTRLLCFKVNYSNYTMIHSTI